MSESRVVRMIAADHPCLAGHFPGNPVVPGVLLLDFVRAAVLPVDTTLAEIETAKFHGVLRPGEPFEILWTQAGNRIRFRCATSMVIAAGTMRIDMVGRQS